MVYDFRTFTVPIVAIVVGGAITVVVLMLRHQERIAKIERGIGSRRFTAKIISNLMLGVNLELMSNIGLERSSQLLAVSFSQTQARLGGW